MKPWRSAVLAVGLALACPRPAAASIADWRVNEVLASAGGDGSVRFIELFVPAGTVGNCVFPTTRIEVYDGQGQLLGTASPFASTVCYGGGTFFLIATDAAMAHFGLTRDARLDLPVPAFAGQVCFASSQTRYDCARWGPVGVAIRYLRNIDDTTSTGSMPDGVAVARVQDTGVVADDFVLEAPTPGAANAGTIFTGPDAGMPADARPPPDAPSLPDARTDFSHPDAPVLDRPDANLNPRFLAADPGGGAGCSVAGRPQAGWLALLILVLRLGSTVSVRRRN